MFKWILKKIINLLKEKKEEEPFKIPKPMADIVNTYEYKKFLEQKVLEEQKYIWYEKICKKIKLKLNPPDFLKDYLQENILLSRLHITPEEVFSTSLLLSAVSFLIIFIIHIISTFIMERSPFYLFYIFPPLIFWFLLTFPEFYSQVLKIKAQDEATQIILLLSVYLRFSPNFENAVRFAAMYSDGPISKDLRKIMWDVESGKYVNIGNAIKSHSILWAKWDPDFVRSLNILFNSLSKIDENEREKIITDALKRILNATHIKMRLYTEKLTPKILMLHTLGILLPIMGLIMFPMISIFLNDRVDPMAVAIGYIIILPIIIYTQARRILSTKPGAYSMPNISLHPDVPPKGYFYVKVEDMRLKVPVVPIAVIVSLLILIPGLIHFTTLAFELHGLKSNQKKIILYKEAEIFRPHCIGEFISNGYFKDDTCKPGLNNFIATYSITLGVAAFAIIYFFGNSFQKIKIMRYIQKLEDDFRTGLFILSNHLSNGTPIESAIERVIDEYKSIGATKSPMLDFFMKIDDLIKRNRMTFKTALFGEYGVLRYFPSVLIRETMKIVYQSIKKGPIIAGKITRSIVEYMENVRDVMIKIRETLEEARTSLRMQASVITPMICAVVATMGTFMINILRILGAKLDEIGKSLNVQLFEEGGTEGLMKMIGINFTKIMPFTVFQIILGVYMVEVVILMAYLLNGIENGFNNVTMNYTIGKTLIIAVVVYSLVSMISLFVFGELIKPGV